MTPAQRATMHRIVAEGVVGWTGLARRYAAPDWLSCPYCRTPFSASVWSLSFACPCGAVAEWDAVVGAGVAVPWVAWWTPGSTPEWWWGR